MLQLQVHFDSTHESILFLLDRTASVAPSCISSRLIFASKLTFRAKKSPVCSHILLEFLSGDDDVTNYSRIRGLEREPWGEKVRKGRLEVDIRHKQGHQLRRGRKGWNQADQRQS